MQINTAFSIGDKIWTFQGKALHLRTVGEVRVTLIDTPGFSEALDLFNNYSAQKSYEEEYMCVETGIGTGIVFKLNITAFATEAECLAASLLAAEADRLRKEASRREYLTELLKEEAHLQNRLALTIKAKAEWGM